MGFSFCRSGGDLMPETADYEGGCCRDPKGQKSALGQSEKSARSTGKSALPPTPDMTLQRAI